MNARNQLFVVLMTLMLVCSSGAVVTAKAPGDTIDQSSEVSADEYDSTNETANETANETGGDEQVVDNETEAADNESAHQPAYVTFTDQTTDGETVVVENVTLASPGFVTIHDSSLLVNNTIDSVIGTSEYLEAGTHENVTVTFDEPLEESETLIAMPHRDTNQNQTYDFVETDGEEDGPFLTPDGEAVTDDAVVTVEGATADEEPGEDNVTDDEPAVDDEEDNVTEDEPVADDEEDNVTEDEPVADDEDNVTDDEPVVDEEDNVTEDEPVADDEDNVTDEEPIGEMPMDELPAAADGQPVIITVESPTIENLNVENVTVYVLVVGEDVDADQISDQLDNVTDDEEEPVLDDEEDNVTDDEEDPVLDDEEDNVTDDEEDPVLDEEEDNVTDDEEEPVLDEEEEDLGATAFNISDLEAPDSATVGENITVTANASNPTDEERTEAIQFRLEGDLVAEQNVTLESDDSEIVEFEVDTTDLEPGEYIHMVLGDEAGEVAMIELTEAEAETDDAEDDIGLDNETEDDTGLDNDTNESDTDSNETGDGFDD